MLLLLSLALFGQASALLINNGVDGEPNVECGPTHIEVTVNTLNPFEGHVFVKGRFQELGCRNSRAGGKSAGIRLGFEECGVSRVRSLNPRGVFVQVVLVTSFHPLFVTKVDRAYKVQCFYMETDKTVEADQILDVSFNLDDYSHIPTLLVTQGLPMPVCRYEIKEEGPGGRPIVFAEVGQAVYHKWTCDSETVDTFCMVVRDCFVDDKQGAKVDLINSFGCAEDRFLLNNIEYTSDLMAGVATNVFKYADRPQLAFQCQISIFVKEPNEACPRPYCSEPGGRGAGSENLEAGPPPAAPDHPFPLGPLSPYLPKEGEEVPKNVVAIPAPVEPQVQADSGRQQSGYVAAPPAPPPTQAGYYGQGAGPRSAPSPLADGWTAFEGPSLRSRLYNQYRSKRSVATQEAGVLDVRTELNALEVEEKVNELPGSLSGPVEMAGGRVCASTQVVGVFLGAAAVVLLAAVGFMAAAALRVPKA